ncbi:DUF3526 domain-containing protein [Agaribacterium haliotis]|uniref:DUF3526 domain-containing protein n=1 Tax=Agaribacterium haliotis TaxID=2013869 RepID=UPI000BB58655|nr:DUF3526 domain-containing protein [Agaribacterium haliotis]
MISPQALLREAKFIGRDRTVTFYMLVTVVLASLSLGSGLIEVQQQKTDIQHLLKADQQDRNASSEKLKDWGSAAYYSFHITYDAPSDFAFAALGQRELQPWKHRIRMLALEGQIYERDADNPVVALIGRFDFAFFAAFVFPLLLIILLYDIKSSERSAGRFELLQLTSANGSLWLTRSFILSASAYLCIAVPLLIAGLIAGTKAATLSKALLFVLINTAIWTLLCSVFSSLKKPSSFILMSLIGLWLCLAVVFPAGIKLISDRSTDMPSGADILMLQRETVNDAWDLPKQETMNAFFAEHPKWSDYKAVESSFEWPWYYAFQQVGDQRTKTLSKAYRDGKIRRDQIAHWASVLSPPAFLERSLQALAKTDQTSSIHYQDRVRAFHAELRAFYYPKFFQNQPFDQKQLDKRPVFKPSSQAK